jgi:hypothetical protein
MEGISMHDKASAPASHRRSRWASAAAVGASMLRDRRGAASLTQTLILLSAVALLAFAGYQALGSTVSDSADCAGKSVEALRLVPCEDGDEGGGSRPVSDAPPAPKGDSNREGGDRQDEIDPMKELIQLALDIFGVTDAVKCFTEGDILACALTLVSFSPWKIFGVIGKLASNAKRIGNLIERLSKTRKAENAEEGADKAGDSGRAAEEGKQGDDAGKGDRGKNDESDKKDEGDDKDKGKNKGEHECDKLYSAYEAMKGKCLACKGTDTPTERGEKVKCFTKFRGLREDYLGMRCDYINPRGPRSNEDRERGHNDQVVQINNALKNCDRLPMQ